MNYIRHLFRDRRRFLLSATLILISTYLTPEALPDPIPLIPSEMLVIIAFFIAMPVVTIYAHQYRHFIEVVAFANLIFATFGWLLPGSVANLAGPHANYTQAGVIYFAALLASYYFLYGKWSDRLTPQRTFRVATKMRSTADMRHVWYGLIAFPGHLDLYADPETLSADYLDPAHRVVRLIYWGPPDRHGEFMAFMDEVEKFKRAKIRLKITEGVSDAAADGTTEFQFRDTGKYRKVKMTFDAKAIAPRRMLRYWLDDTMGRMMDSRIAAIEWNALYPNNKRAPISYDSWWLDRKMVTQTQRDPQTGYRTAHGRTLSSAECAALTVEKEARKAAGRPKTSYQRMAQDMYDVA